jgi:hypothetical protein
MDGGLITATGDRDEMLAVNPGAQVVDLSGRVVTPGFVDAHCHFELTTTHRYAVPLHAAPHSSLREICQTLRDRAASSPGDGWIIGRANFGLHQFVTEKRPLTRQDLDDAKKNGKLRPLGLPTWSDKLLGEVMRLLLEAYYEPQFSGRRSRRTTAAPRPRPCPACLACRAR